MSPKYERRYDTSYTNRKEAETAVFAPSDRQESRTVKYAAGLGTDDSRLPRTR